MEQFVRKEHKDVKFFVGNEIEQTPAFNKKTLFVVGLQDVGTIDRLAKQHNAKHIFASANRSFDSVELVDGVYKVGDTLASDWANQIQELLTRGYMVSLDYPAHKHAMVLNILPKEVWQSRNFVPVLSVAIPHVNTSNVNLTVKIDDSNFAATNPGVWCMNHQEVTDSNRFTSWAEYGDDAIISETGDEVRKVIYVDLGDATPAEAKEMLETIKESFNNEKLGLDTESTSLLKPEVTEEIKNTTVETINDDLAAKVYAESGTPSQLETLTPAATTEVKTEKPQPKATPKATGPKK